MYIAIDIGGTKTNLLAFETLDPGSLVSKRTFPTTEILEYEVATRRITDECLQLVVSRTIDAIGIAITGDINPKTGQVLDSLFLNRWKGKELAKDLSKIIGAPVYVENDAVCAGLAELSNINNGKHRNYTFIAIGTGVGGVKLMKYSNTTFIFPWDFGHMIVDLDGPICLCGQPGCLEVYASGSGIKHRYGKPLEEISDPQVWQDLVDHMAQAIVSYMAVNPTEKFIFGGGISHKTPGLVDRIESRVRELSTSELPFPGFELARYAQEAQAYGLLQLMNSPVTLVNVSYA